MSSQDLLHKLVTSIFTSTHCSNQSSHYITQKILPLISHTLVHKSFLLSFMSVMALQGNEALLLWTWLEFLYGLSTACKLFVLLNLHSTSLWVACALKSGFTWFSCLVWANSVTFLSGSGGFLLVCLPFSFPIFCKYSLSLLDFYSNEIFKCLRARSPISWLRQNLTPSQIKKDVRIKRLQKCNFMTILPTYYMSCHILITYPVTLTNESEWSHQMLPKQRFSDLCITETEQRSSRIYYATGFMHQPCYFPVLSFVRVLWHLVPMSCTTAAKMNMACWELSLCFGAKNVIKGLSQICQDGIESQVLNIGSCHSDKFRQAIDERSLFG